MDWIWLKEINESFPVVFECSSVFQCKRGIFVLICQNEVISVKFSIQITNQNKFNVDSIARLKGVKGLQFVNNDENSWVLTKDQKVFAFKSHKKIFGTPCLDHVRLFECFSNSCYAVVEQFQNDVKLLLYDRFDSRGGSCRSKFDLSFPSTPITVGGNRKNEKICVEIIEKINDTNFFSELLACEIDKESIVEIVLIAIDEKLLWVKYKGTFREDPGDDYSIETITVLRDKIRGLKYLDGILAALDYSSLLSIFYICPITRLIRKREILLEGNVTCFRFHRDRFFVYSNLDQIIFIDLKYPQDTVKQHVKLAGITSLTIVEDLQPFLLGVCRNQMVYYIKFPSRKRQKAQKSNDFEETDLETIPEVARYLENSEAILLKLEDEIKKFNDINKLFTYLSSEKDVKGGEAEVRFHQKFPVLEDPENVLFIKSSNQQVSSSFIEIRITFSRIFRVLNCFEIVFRQKSSTGVNTSIFKTKHFKEKLQLLILDNDDKTEMNLELSIFFSFKGRIRMLRYPITIKEVIHRTEHRAYLRDSLKICLDTVALLKM